MVNYNNGLIYKLACKDINVKNIYVGSTTNFNRRKQKHKSNSSNANSKNYNCYVYQFIRKNGGWDNFDMIEVEKYSCNDKKELHSRERYWFETLQASLNKCVPNRSNKEYREDNKEHIKERNKEYYEDNKEHKKAYQKEYRKNNKEKIKERANQKFTCDCGGKYSYGQKERHLKSKKHQKYLENKHSI